MGGVISNLKRSKKRVRRLYLYVALCCLFINVFKQNLKQGSNIHNLINFQFRLNDQHVNLF